jgi:hypothetical protein
MTLRPERVIAFFLLLTVGVGLFYWYELRPSQIRSACSERAKEETREAAGTGKTSKIGDPRAYYDARYVVCVRERGLKN